MVPIILYIRVPPKMYHDLREVYWWDGLKRYKAELVGKFPNFKQVKDKNLKPSGLTQIMDASICKWEDINMEFVVGFLEFRGKVTQYGLLLIGWPNMPTLSTLSLYIRPKSMQGSTLIRLWVFMGFLCPSFPIDNHNHFLFSLIFSKGFR